MSIYDSTLQIIIDSINANRRHQTTLIDNDPCIKEELSITDWAKEFATVNINLGRRTGKTTAINTLSGSLDNSMVICYNYTLLKLQYKGNYDAITAAQLGHRDIVDKPSFIFIDEPYLISSSIPKDTIYKKLATTEFPQCFIFVGTQ